MATKGYLMLLGGMREIERILKERMHEDEETIEENGVPLLVESMADQIDDLREQLKAATTHGEAPEDENEHESYDWWLKYIKRFGPSLAGEEVSDLLADFGAADRTRPAPAEGLREAFMAGVLSGLQAPGEVTADIMEYCKAESVRRYPLTTPTAPANPGAGG